MSRVPRDEPELALAVDFLNTYDALDTPPDRLSVEVVRGLAAKYGRPLDDLRPGHLKRLRELRERLRPVFAAPEPADKVAALDGVLRGEGAGLELALDEDGTAVTLRAVGGRDAPGRFAVLLANALAQAITGGGPDRFGTCVADPCRCVYVDRTRAGRQRFCCQLCNDRVSAASYRSRARAATADDSERR